MRQLMTQRRLTLLSPYPTARAIAYSEPSCCSDGLQAGRTANDVDDRRTPVGLDFVRRTVLVEVRAPALMDDLRSRAFIENCNEKNGCGMCIFTYMLDIFIYTSNFPVARRPA